MKLWVKILLAMLFGLLVGLLFEEKALFLKPVGSLFLNLIHMAVTLIVFTSITVGITGIGDSHKLSRIGIKTLLFYLANTLIAIFLGFLLAKLAGLGTWIRLYADSTHVSQDIPSIGSMLLGIIPSNPVRALVEGNVMQVIVFSLFLGLAINLAGEKGEPLKQAIQSASDVMFTLTGMIMEFSPIGVFGVMAWAVGSFGFAAILPLVKFLVVYYTACLIQFFVVFGGSLKYIANVSPRPFFDAMRETAMVAFSTCSSSAALPTAMKSVEENLGVSRTITSFVLPLGSTINMAGAAIFQAMSAIFIANAYRIELEWMQLITLALSATLSAVGAAGIPGTGFIMLSAVLSSAGLPIEGLALLAGIDRLREMVSTVVNSLGDAAVAVVIAKGEGELDLEIYNAPLKLPIKAVA